MKTPVRKGDSKSLVEVITYGKTVTLVIHGKNGAATLDLSQAEIKFLVKQLAQHIK